MVILLKTGKALNDLGNVKHKSLYKSINVTFLWLSDAFSFQLSSLEWENNDKLRNRS